MDTENSIPSPVRVELGPGLSVIMHPDEKALRSLGGVAVACAGLGLPDTAVHYPVFGSDSGFAVTRRA